jgi:hypothetical protein
MNLETPDREDVWLLLADLFFLDAEYPDAFYQTAAERLRQMGLGSNETEAILIYEVAPVAGSNLSYLMWPVIGVWDGFDREHLCDKIRSYLMRRAARPQWHYFLQDRWLRYMVRMLEPGKLLDRL